MVTAALFAEELLSLLGATVVEPDVWLPVSSLLLPVSSLLLSVFWFPVDDPELLGESDVPAVWLPVLVWQFTFFTPEVYPLDATKDGLELLQR